MIFSEGLEEIDDWAFSDCNALEEIDLPKTLLKIGENAFQNCENLNFVQFPDSLLHIGDWAFCNCPSLEMAELNEDTEFGIEVFEETTQIFYR